MVAHWTQTVSAALAAFTILLAGAVPAAAVNLSLDVAVTGSENDAAESGSGVVTLTGATLELGGNYKKVGLRFTSVNIPRNAAITRAYIEFTAASQDSAATTLTFEVQASDNAPAFAATPFNVQSRATYSQTVEWRVDFPWVTVDQAHQSPELKDLVQKVVSRSGWAANNAVAFIVTGSEEIYRRAVSWDADPAKAPRLHVEYTANVVEVRIDRSLDDLYQQYFGPMSSTVTNSDTFYFGNSTSLYPGLRFRNVDVPEGATINYACIRFTAKQAHTAEGGYVRFYGEKRLNAPEFSTSGSSTAAPYSRKVTGSVPKTTTYVQWSGLGAWEADREYSSADLKAVVQEIVGISGWGTSDKTMVFLMNPGGGTLNRYARSYDYAADKAPVLHIEYGQTGGGSASGPAVMTVGNTDLGRSCFQGAAAENQNFTLINSGASTLSYSSWITFKNGSNWFSIAPGPGTGSLGPGEAQDYTVVFNTAGLPIGLYEGTISFNDPNAATPTIELKVGLTVMRQDTLRCGDVPLYTQSVSSPTVMILLDSSGSMADKVDIYDGSTMRPHTPDLKPIVQELVNRDGWSPGNAMAFIFEHLSGTGRRYARSYDGFTLSAARLHVEYKDGSADKSIDVQVNKSTDDGEATGGCMWSSSTPQVTLATPGSGMGGAFRFENVTIPRKAAVTNAYLEFVPYMTETTLVAVTVYGEANDNPPTFGQFDCVTPELMNRVKTSASVAWDIPPWTGVTTDTRIAVAKAVISELVKDTSISWGFGTWTTDAAGYVPEKDYTIIHVGTNAHTAEHQARLQAAIAATESRSSTPFSRSLLAGATYFKGTRSDEFGNYFVEAACQPKFVIEVTDGMGNIDSTLANTIERAGVLADTGVTAVAIGFGLSEVDAAQLYALADVANRRGEAAPGDALYAMHRKDETGKALPYLTFDKEGLIAALRTVTNSIKGAVFYGSAPAATTSTDLGDVVLVSSFDAGNWTGDVRAIAKSSQGAWQEEVWRASEHLPAARSVWTTDASNLVIPYTSATLDGDNYLCKPIGDIINSTPLVVGAPPFFYTFNDYPAFKRRYTLTDPREAMVYVGSNDGLLHAFGLSDGAERWAFLPYSLQERLKLAAAGESYDMCSGGYCHQPTLDGSPVVADVYTGSVKRWRTMLLVGQRQGGTAYTALDVTSGQSPDPANADPAAFLWELNDSDMGESWAEAAVERVADPSAGAGAAAWAAFMSSGYDPVDNLQPDKQAFLFGVNAYSGLPLWTVDGAAVSKIRVTHESGWQLAYSSYSGSAPEASDTLRVTANNATACTVKVKRVVAHTSGANNTGGYGTLLLETDPAACGFATGTAFQIPSKGASGRAAGPAAPAGQKNNALSSPAVADLTGTGIQGCLYTGDLYGTLYRVDQIGKGQSPAVTRLFQFNPYPSGPDLTPIRGKASVAGNSSGDGVWVYYGTGRYETTADKTSRTPQYLFGLKDGATARQAPYSLSDLVALQARFASSTVNGAPVTVRTLYGSNPTADSWAVQLYAGQSGWGGATVGASERVFTKPLTVGGIVFFTTFIPDADQCTGSGDTWVFALDYKTGLPPSRPVFDLNGDGKFTDADKIDVNGAKTVPVGVYVGRGQGSAPVLFKDTLFITTSNPQIQAPGVGGGAVTGLNALLVNIPQKKIRLESWKHE